MLALVGVAPLDFPFITYNAGGSVQYNSSSDSFSLSARPVGIDIDAPTPGGFFFTGTFDINIRVDGSGALIGGVAGDDLLLTGDVDVNGDFVVDYFAINGPLLTGEVSAFGFQDSGNDLDFFDFRFTVTGGQLVTAGYFVAGSHIGVTTTSENSNFVNNFNVNFNGNAKGELGAKDQETATKTGRKYHDLNADGDDEGGSDPALAGWTIAAFADNDNSNTLSVGDSFATSDVTDANGVYSLTLTPGQKYIIVERVSDQPGWFESPDDDAVLVNNMFNANFGQYGYVVTLAAGQTESGNDFGNYQNATKSGVKYEDKNADGDQDPEDKGLSGWTIAAFLDKDNSKTLSAGDSFATSTVTGAGGAYSLLLAPGSYIIVEQISDQPFFWIESPDDDTTLVNDGFNANYGKYGYAITLTSGQTESGNDFGNYRNAAKSGIKYEDKNADGDQDPEDKGLGGWTIAAFADNNNNGKLDAGDTLAKSNLTKADGTYSLPLAPGNYIIVEKVSDQPGWFESPDDDTTLVNNGFNPDYGKYGYAITLTSGDSDTGNDFANFRKRPGIDIEKTTNGPTNSNPIAPDYDNEDAENGPGVPILTPGSKVTWTYKVTNTGGTNYNFSEVVIVDDNGTPGNPADDLSTTNGQITFLSVQTGDADNILEPGEVWLYQASGIVKNVGSSGSSVSFDFSGNSGTDGPDGNIRTFTSGGISVNASAFSRDSGGNWLPAFLGSYSGGLGVTDTSEGSGRNNSHTVDNVGRNNFVLFEFSESVVIDSAFLGYVVNDSDLHIWIGNVPNAFNNHQALSDAFLAGLGFNEPNNTSSSSPRTANVNAGEVVGNVIVISAAITKSSPDDEFKIEKIKIKEHACYENKAVVTVPDGSTDSDLSHYCNPDGEPDIKIKKLTNGVDAETEEDAPLIAPGATVTWTYEVTNTGAIAFGAHQVVVKDDNGTPNISGDDFMPTRVLASDVGGDNVLSPGETWVYTASAVAQNLGSSGSAATFNFSGNSSTDGTDGNIRSFTAGGVSVNASAFSRDSGGNWQTAFLGSYSDGLGVTDRSEGNGSNNTHTVDNAGRDNYVLFEFSETVVVDSAFLGYVVGDSDIRIWIGTVTDAFNDHQSLSDPFLAGLGFTEVNETTSGSPRTADFNAGKRVGNVLVIAANTGESSQNDKFKIEKLKIEEHACYQNKAVVTVPGASDSDLSFYCNPQAPPPSPGIKIKKFTNGVDADTAADAPEIAPGATVTWTYKVTNTGNVPFTSSEVVVRDDNGTPSNTGDDFSPTFDATLSAGLHDGDSVLEPGEMWVYKKIATAQNLTASGSSSTFNLSGNTSTTGSNGNIRTFTSGGVSVKTSAFSRDSGGTWQTAYLGSYGDGLGVTDRSENGSSNSHTVDNSGRNNYVLFEFSEPVVVDSAFLGYVVDDSDLHIWIGNVANAFNNHQTLSDAFLTGLGFNEPNNTSSSSPRTADVNAGQRSGNVIVISAAITKSSPDDEFKIEKLTINKIVPGIYKNVGKVTAGNTSDSDPSHYKNPAPGTPPNGDGGGNGGNGGNGDGGHNGGGGKSDTKFFVVDDGYDDKTFRYNATGSPGDTSSLHSDNKRPVGIASNLTGTKTWVIDVNRKVYVYDGAGTFLGSWTASGLSTPEGITTDGTDIWIVDEYADKVVRYAGAASRLSGSQQPTSSFNLNNGNREATGITTDGSHFWVVNYGDPGKVFKYTVAGSLVGSWTIDSRNDHATGITIDPADVKHIWIVDMVDRTVYEYRDAVGRTSGSQSAANTFRLKDGNSNPQGIADPLPRAEGEGLRAEGEGQRAEGEERRGSMGLSPATSDLAVTSWAADRTGIAARRNAASTPRSSWLPATTRAASNNLAELISAKRDTNRDGEVSTQMEAKDTAFEQIESDDAFAEFLILS